MQFIKSNKDKILTVLFCFVISFVVLTFTSKCSFLYPFNDWVDANAFFTVGKSWFNGIIPYLDIFEQKGPFLYLIYGIGYLLSNTSFLGIFILEVLAWTITLYYVHKINLLYFDKKISFIIIPLFIALITSNACFAHGGSAEEFLFPFFSITLYYFLSFFKDKDISYKRLFLAGLFAGLVLLTKYTLLGFWFAFMACIFFLFLYYKNYKKAFKSCFIFLLGMGIPFVLFLIYMAIVGGVKEFINVYFVINMTSYAGTSSSIIDRAITLVKGFISAVRLNGIDKCILLLLLPIFLLKIDISKEGKISILITYLFTILGIYVGLVFYVYYLLPVEFFLLISLIGIFSFINKHINLTKIKGLVVISIVLSLFISYYRANYKEFRNTDKKDLFQYQFAEYINKFENPTMVNMGFLDSGVYTMANILPSTYFFEEQNFSYDRFSDNIDSFHKYIEDKETLFIVYYTTYEEEKLKKNEPRLFENYELVMKREQEFEKDDYFGYLFLRRES